LPQNKVHELRRVREEWERENPPPRGQKQWELLARETTEKSEKWLDQGLGSCLLEDDTAAERVVEAMRYFDGERYELYCHVVMPNHVHLIVRPLIPDTYPLERILQSWKTFTSREINRLFGREGRLWQEENFDRIIRDEEHLYRVIQYIGHNPAKGGRTPSDCRLWLRPQWEELGWNFDETVSTEDGP
jgi:REP element-mobilizing transposase RayT